MSLWKKTGSDALPKSLNRAQKRQVIATSAGWVRRVKVGTRSKDEILVAIGDLANATNMGFPRPTDMWHEPSAGVINSFVNTYISFSEPLAWTAGRVKLNVANTITGNTMVAFSSGTTISGSNNTIMVRWRPTVAGTYKVQAQTFANASATAVTLKSTNSGAENANLVISGAISNTSGTIVVSSS